jgi:DNA repair protein RecO (recombination protein O)
MSSIVKTDAIVLRAIKYGETSKIVTFYTKQFGKISAIAKGARHPKSKYGSSLDPVSYVSIVVYKKEGREIQTLSQCELQKSLNNLLQDIQKMAAAMAVVELVTIVAHEQEENQSLFKLLADSLSAINHTTNNPLILLYTFELQLARILGFQPRFDNCVSCRKQFKLNTENRIVYHLGHAGPLCSSCNNFAGAKMSISHTSFEILKNMSLNANMDSNEAADCNTRNLKEIESFIRQFLQAHVSGMRPLKSEKVFSKILGYS